MDIHKILMQAINERCHLLPEDLGKAVVAQFGMKVPSGKRVTSFHEAHRVASELGYPLVVKAMAPDLIHKSDRGAVKVGVENNSALRKTWSTAPFGENGGTRCGINYRSDQ